MTATLQITLVVVCDKCGKSQIFEGILPNGVIRAAVNAGWCRLPHPGTVDAEYYCPECSEQYNNDHT
ncbi:MAG: hypothetical protein WC444_05200 [Candidatus Paceibacterota bacterium]